MTLFFKIRITSKIIVKHKLLECTLRKTNINPPKIDSYK